MKCHYKDLVLQTEQNNLAQLDSKLTQFLGQHDFFYIEDLCETFRGIVKESGIKDGMLNAQVMHTTAVLSVNELDEPMLLGDINRRLSDLVPHLNDYLHNSKLRTKNLCADDYKCDRNADAHLKSFLIGGHTASLLVRNGELVLGKWQRVTMIDFDGPRQRKVTVQVIGA
ncbi:MAG: hypothetical protein COV45_02895 [Deltaproteobacteria bacterium CG11_big_fil_rev_8_21_14_0_20_47_16]|nr:MAG: hypothetical protein COV45_02895 [Deltaproteobacteria bacterium CG11_big_fil_rev_8_21_14_0_20_47_16]